MDDVNLNVIGRKYPSFDSSEKIGSSPKNSAIELYGRRLYKDQTSIEYLAEFLLVFTSHKGSRDETENSNSTFTFTLPSDQFPLYWPRDHVTLKLFTFFPTSKLDTRHPLHQRVYKKSLEAIKGNIIGDENEKEETVKLLQSLFSGFVGVAQNRTWVTQNFLPASASLISREVMWEHTKALQSELSTWEDSKSFFANDRHNFMARGGELLFLQLSNLFNSTDDVIRPLLKRDNSSYKHLEKVDLKVLQTEIEGSLSNILNSSFKQVNNLVQFIENSLSDYKLENKKATLGWVPSATVTESLLFAVEMKNILNSALSDLEKVELLQLLCSIHVLRTICFQSHRLLVTNKKLDGFIGNFVWIVSDRNATPKNSVRKLATTSLNSIQNILYRALRVIDEKTPGNDGFSQSDPHGFAIFKKIAKEIDMVIPKKGSGERFVITPLILRLLVSSVLEAGERVTLNNFYVRVFAHFGIALGPKQLAHSIKWIGEGEAIEDFSIAADTSWIEEQLKQGGYLEELSDAVSIVVNPSNKAEY
tara:strand:+ start:10948 stop:12543 length:1596 start_codon:yes stop_codon:yes gene_type:complete